MERAGNAAQDAAIREDHLGVVAGVVGSRTARLPDENRIAHLVQKADEILRRRQGAPADHDEQAGVRPAFLEGEKALGHPEHRLVVAAVVQPDVEDQVARLPLC